VVDVSFGRRHDQAGDDWSLGFLLVSRTICIAENYSVPRMVSVEFDFANQTVLAIKKIGFIRYSFQSIHLFDTDFFGSVLQRLNVALSIKRKR
jgi:hypothetical protein